MLQYSIHENTIYELCVFCYYVRMKHTQIIVIVLISFLFASCAALPPAVTEARIIDQDSFGFCHAGTGGIKEKNLLASLGSSLARLDLSWK